MSKVRVCFLGTPEFAVQSLKSLLSDDHFEVVGVVTQPDRPAGRKMQLTPSAVKTFALSKGLNVISPESVKSEEVQEEIKKWTAEVAVVVAFGQILTQKFMDLFAFGAVNIHGSLLPKWRGAAPIQRAVEAGDTETGVTLQKIVKALDAGDVLGVRKVRLDDNITAMELHDQLALLSGELLHVELMDYVRGNLAPVPQDPAGVTHAKKLDKSESQIDWNLSAKQIHNKVRAFTMGPGTFTTLAGKKIKIHRTRLNPQASSAKPGTVKWTGDSLLVQTGQQEILEILELQPESRNKISAQEFAKGHNLENAIFGG